MTIPPLMLMIMSGVDDGRLVECPAPKNGTDYLIGRQLDCDIVLPYDGQVSRYHAALRFQDGHWTLDDKGSKNGTYLDGRRLDQPRPVHAMTLWRVGRTWLRIQSVQSTESTDTELDHLYYHGKDDHNAEQQDFGVTSPHSPQEGHA